MTTPSLIPTRFLFRFAAPCRYHDPLWTAAGAIFDESFRLTSLAELEGQRPWADVRAAWNSSGIALVVEVAGKTEPLRALAGRPLESDGVQLWIDTRDVHNVHRAGRFCHRFIFVPGSDFAATSTKRARTPVIPATAASLPIHRARELPQPVREGLLCARSRSRPDGYRLEIFLPAEALTGFDPGEYPRLGFTYAVVDHELGVQTFGVGNPMPYAEDPSLWATLELQRS
jgi:hypothetical protein